MSDDAPVMVAAGTVRAQIEAIFRGWGMAEEWIAPTVEVMVDTDLAGVDSHGIAMLPLYDHIRRHGGLNMKPAPRIVAETPATALFDADRGLGHAISVRAMSLAVEKAKAVGIGAVSVRNSHHFGAAGAYPMIAAKAGLIGFASTNALSSIMVPTRAKKTFFATNPLAFAVPARRNPPFVLDMSTTTGAVGKVKIAWYAGKLLPEGWLVDPEGRPIRDPEEALGELTPQDGAENPQHTRVGRGRMSPGYGITPLGGKPDTASHKGYGLGAMVEVLSSILSGASFAGDPRGRPKLGQGEDIGHFFLAIDPAAFREADAFMADVDAMIDALHALPAADPAEPVLVPGDPERLNREERLNTGIPVPRKLLDQLRDVCAVSNAPYMVEG
ncbi:Ldh family oxidoreductase [Futiania mangrovi]|uniref:Ldh family oxidoreductase n=1 Tax=Futiania mangrovi TaxID=2959716 RepID=A0A9J6PF76_9PROT|nr:Ldh family oxidoreductase [Futiania mangrovii]MCP1337369.1 Ldh family oxidoreductase [Futiania mangrovii]